MELIDVSCINLKEDMKAKTKLQTYKNIIFNPLETITFQIHYYSSSYFALSNCRETKPTPQLNVK